MSFLNLIKSAETVSTYAETRAIPTSNVVQYNCFCDYYRYVTQYNCVNDVQHNCLYDCYSVYVTQNNCICDCRSVCVRQYNFLYDCHSVMLRNTTVTMSVLRNTTVYDCYRVYCRCDCHCVNCVTVSHCLWCAIQLSLWLSKCMYCAVQNLCVPSSTVSLYVCVQEHWFYQFY